MTSHPHDWPPAGLNLWQRGPARPTAPNAPLVVLVHGVIDSCASFVPIADRLPEYRILAYDRRGYGRSDLPPAGPRTLAEHADDLLDVLEFVVAESGQPATVVGHSMGGNVTAVAAHRRPELFAAIAGFEVHAPWLDCWDPETHKGILEMGNHPDPEGFGESTYRRMRGDAWWEALPEDERLRRRTEGRAYCKDLATGFQTAFAFETTPVPHVMGCGTRSGAFFIRATRRLAETLPARYVEIDGAKHAAHISRPDAFADFVRATVDAGLSPVGD